MESGGEGKHEMWVLAGDSQPPTLVKTFEVGSQSALGEHNFRLLSKHRTTAS